MAIENENAGNDNNNNQQQNQNQQQNNSDIASPLEAMAGLISQKTAEHLANVNRPANSDQQQNQNQQNQNNPAQQNQPNNEVKNEEGNEDAGNKDEQEGADKNKPAQQQNASNEPEQKSVLGLNKNNKSKQGADILVIENPDQMLGAIKSNFGMELKEIKEVPKFFESVKTWRKDAQRLPEAEKEAKNYKGILEALDEPLLEAIKLFHSGKDYAPAFANKPKFDFNKKAEDQDTKELINHYFPNKFTEEDFKEETKSPSLDIAKDAAIKNYNFDKKTREDQRTAYQQNAQRQVEVHKQAVKSSVDHLKQSFPYMEEDALNEVASVFEGGVNSVMSHFYNKDGTPKPEAAEMFMMAKYGKSEISRMMTVASHNAETKTNEEILTRGADGPKPKTTPAQNPISKEAQEKITELQNLSRNRKKTF